jgi:cobalt-zinc-cadmium efflux system outer membrane protein
MTFRRWSAVLVASALLAPAGCLDSHALTPDQAAVSDSLRERTGAGLGPDVPPGRVFVPNTVSLDEGLSADAAVQLALCNNALFQDLLLDLGLARADVVQAGLLPNPEVLYSFPVSPKPFKYAVDLPIDVIALRPVRVRAAAAEEERARERLVQAGLDLARDVRLAHADWVFARDRLRVAEEIQKLRDRIAKLTTDRFNAGDATPLEVSTARADSLRGKQEATRAANDLPIFEEKLRNLVGIGGWRVELVPQGADPPDEPAEDLEALVAEAVAARPDVRAAERFIAAADARVQIARLGWIRFLGIADATSGPSGHNLSPEFRVTVPVFSGNQGAIARAGVERERAVRQLRTVRDRAILEVRQAHAQHVQAAADYQKWTEEIRPAVEEAVRRAEATYEKGGASLVLVLETSRQLIDTRAREAQLRADLTRAWAELERAVGRRMQTTDGDFAAQRDADSPEPPSPSRGGENGK